MKYFLFLEILDKNIFALLYGLKRQFEQHDSNLSLHVTIRGPYENLMPGLALKNYELALKSSPIKIYSAGIFHNKEESIVFLKISNPRLREIWWKPDYPLVESFNPHISLYKGRNKNLAKCIYNFLRKEKLELLCYNFCLKQYASKQEDLFSNNCNTVDMDISPLVKKRLVNSDIFLRAVSASNKSTY